MIDIFLNILSGVFWFNMAIVAPAICLISLIVVYRRYSDNRDLRPNCMLKCILSFIVFLGVPIGLIIMYLLAITHNTPYIYIGEPSFAYKYKKIAKLCLINGFLISGEIAYIYMIHKFFRPKVDRGILIIKKATIGYIISTLVLIFGYATAEKIIKNKYVPERATREKKITTEILSRFRHQILDKKGDRHTVRVEAHVAYQENDDLKNKALKSEVETKKEEIQKIFKNTIMSKDFDQLHFRHLDSLESELLPKINSLLKEGTIDDIYWSEYIVQ